MVLFLNRFLLHPCSRYKRGGMVFNYFVSFPYPKGWNSTRILCRNKIYAVYLLGALLITIIYERVLILLETQSLFFKMWQQNLRIDFCGNGLLCGCWLAHNSIITKSYLLIDIFSRFPLISQLMKVVNFSFQIYVMIMLAIFLEFHGLDYLYS